jgi:hypothetical protein
MKTIPWWLHFARIGHSVGAGIAVAAVFAPFTGPVAPFIGILATVGGIVTHYSDIGIAAAKND